MQILSVSTNGARNMKWLSLGVVTRMCQAALEYIYRIWCGAHQLDLVIENVLSVVLKKSFYFTLTGFIRTLSASRISSPTWARPAQNSSIITCPRTKCSTGLRKSAPAAPARPEQTHGFCSATHMEGVLTRYAFLHQSQCHDLSIY